MLYCSGALTDFLPISEFIGNEKVGLVSGKENVESLALQLDCYLKKLDLLHVGLQKGLMKM